MHTALATPTTDAAAYAADDALGTVMTFIDTEDSPTKLIQRVLVVDATNQKKDMDLVLFSEPPTNPVANNVAFAVHADDRAKLIGIIPITTHKSLGSGGGAVGMSTAGNLGVILGPVKGDEDNKCNKIYGQLVVRAAGTYAADALRVHVSFM